MESSREVTGEVETISNIQNYLASFNKEIQDGTTSGSSDGGQQILQSQNVETAAFYTVAQTTNEGQVEGYSYRAPSQSNYVGTTYYASPDGTYYTTTEIPEGSYSSQETSSKVVHTHGSDFQDLKSATSHLSQLSQGQSVVTTVGNDHNSLQQIVLAVSEAANVREGAACDAQEISVSIPASIAAHVGHEGTEQLLHAMERQGTTIDNSASEQPTFVAMQPGSDHNGHINDGQTLTIVTADSQEDENDSITHRSHHPQAIHMVMKQPDGTETEQTLPISSASGSTLVTADGQEIHVNDDGTLQMMANIAEHAAASGVEGNNQVILNTGNSYQTVTIVPSDTNPGEVSYVLIVSQPEDGKSDKGMDLDMSVYDFNESEKHGELVTAEVTADGTKMHTIKITPKRSQQVTQAHMCNYCNYTSPKRYLLSRHMKSHSEERPHKCSVCERGFKTLASLQNHVNTHTGTRPHHCKECPSAFTTSGELVRHVRYKHTHEKPHRCTECDYASVELSKLKRHMRCHTGERPYQCPHCTYASPDTYKLKRHLRIHTGEKPYECDVCHAKFTQSNSLKAHKLIHSGNKPIFRCELCPTTCGRKTDLRIHMQKLHNTDKPMKCKRCGKMFPDRYNYKIHAKTHEGEKCFKCDLCSYASISQRHLESHMLIHTDQKPFCCDECDQSFRQKQLLRRHKNLYHDPNYIPPVPKEKTNECCECGKSFRHKGNLIRHMAIHDPDATAAQREAALRIGQPKGPGEQPDGEEDFMDEYDENEIRTNGAVQSGNDEQLVVFEVIQLPTGDGSIGENQIVRTMSDGRVTLSSANDSQNVTIIQQVQTPAGSLAEEVAAAIAQVHGDDTGEISDLISPLKQEEFQQNPRQTITSSPSTPKRGRGRPRKYPLHSESSDNTSILRDGDGGDQVGTTLLVMETRHGRKKRAAETGDEAETIVTISSPKGGRPSKIFRRNDKISEGQSEMEEMVITIANDPEEVERKEAEIIQRKLEQKQKDMDECFGFNEDEEEEETILAMPTVPGMTLNAIHSTDENITLKATNISQSSHLYNSVQHDSG